MHIFQAFAFIIIYIGKLIQIRDFIIWNSRNTKSHLFEEPKP